MGDVAQLITAFATLIASIGTLVIGFRNSRKLEIVHQATNGLTSKLVNLTAESAKAEGNLEGRAELKSEQDKT
jgi:hypothetical protein